MNKDSLDHLLSSYRAKELPAAPTNLEQNVWREIRLRSASAGESLGASFWDWIQDRRLITASVAVALTVGVVFNLQAPSVSARQAMGLRIFSHNAYSPIVELAQSR